MRKRPIGNVLTGIYVLLLFLTSCVEDKSIIPPAQTDNSFTEEFDTVQAAMDRGWHFLNHSNPLGRTWVTYASLGNYPHREDIVYSPDWQQACDYYSFGAYSSKGTKNGYLSTCWAANGNFPIPDGSEYDSWYINNWAVSPLVTMKNGDKIVFYTRCDTTARLQVRINKNNTDYKNIGFTPDESGDFNTLILDINPTAIKTGPNSGPSAYPSGNWTRFEATIYGLEKPVQGRFAFRSLLSSGWDGNIWGYPSTKDLDVLLHRLDISVLGIDKVQYISK